LRAWLSYSASTFSLATRKFPQADAAKMTQDIEAHGLFPWHARCISQGHDRAASPEFLTRGARMNWDRIEGNWKQLKGKIKEQWGKLTDDDIDTIAGKRDQLAGKLQNSYGITKDEAEGQIESFADRYGDYDDATTRSVGPRH
jgi:uncharacterized protein YjbJ (UPF0337 family)